MTISAVSYGQSIVIVEDDDELRAEGFSVDGVASGTQLLERIEQTSASAFVIDIGLPDSDGRDVCQALRARGVDAPVLFLTARGSVPDRISGFHAGGDDYLTKPFAIAELLVRVDALLRRNGPDRPAPVEEPPAGFVLDPGRHAVR